MTFAEEAINLWMERHGSSVPAIDRSTMRRLILEVLVERRGRSQLEAISFLGNVRDTCALLHRSGLTVTAREYGLAKLGMDPYELWYFSEDEEPE